jgi:hypothetical protein
VTEVGGQSETAVLPLDLEMEVHSLLGAVEEGDPHQVLSLKLFHRPIPELFRAECSQFSRINQIGKSPGSAGETGKV